MSAWYVFSAMGFYPVTPGSDLYVIGSPIFDKVSINLESGKQFVISTNNNQRTNIYINSTSLNKKDYRKSFITHNDIVNGGTLEFEMSHKPNYNYANQDVEKPFQKVKEQFTPIENKYIFKPFVDIEKELFSDSLVVNLNSANKNAKIFYTIDESVPDNDSFAYSSPITSDTSFTLKAVSYVEGLGKSELFERRFSKAIIRNNDKQSYPTIELKYPHTKRYNGSSPYALIDGIKGTTNFLDGKWQGFLEVDLDAVIDLGEPIEINRVSASFMRDQGSWIFLPKEIIFSVSLDGKTFDEIQSIKWQSLPEHNEKMLKVFSADIKKETRYIRVIAKNLIKNPEWHYAAGNNAFIFADEITIEQN
jgi:hypothetical protein